MAEKLVAEPAFVARLSDALRSQLPGSEVTPEQIRAERYRFVVVWDKFDAMGHPERQRLVWNIVSRELNREDIQNVGMILTLGLEDLPSDE
ncbi:MAG TPA: hypothetical protein VK797_14185 [Tepidisphaeraceae bacterium]|jgi:hypothetical protein|nr:hypothetical protein [Tepidisphaeraceae bacterium]